jgi:hypothetical protein
MAQGSKGDKNSVPVSARRAAGNALFHREVSGISEREKEDCLGEMKRSPPSAPLSKASAGGSATARRECRATISARVRIASRNDVPEPTAVDSSVLLPRLLRRAAGASWCPDDRGRFLCAFHRAEQTRSRLLATTGFQTPLKRSEAVRIGSWAFRVELLLVRHGSPRTIA